MSSTPGGRSAGALWLGGVPVIAAPSFAVLWLALALTSEGGGLAAAVIKIVFCLVVVGTTVSGIKWTTASGLALFIEAMAALVWVAIRADKLPPLTVARSTLLLGVPLAVCGVMLVLYGGLRAGTWPPARARGPKHSTQAR